MPSPYSPQPTPWDGPMPSPSNPPPAPGVTAPAPRLPDVPVTPPSTATPMGNGMARQQFSRFGPNSFAALNPNYNYGDPSRTGGQYTGTVNYPAPGGGTTAPAPQQPEVPVTPPGGGAPPTMDQMAWLQKNMPSWMRSSGQTPQAMMAYITQHPSSPIAAMYNQAWPGAAGGGATAVGGGAGGGMPTGGDGAGPTVTGPVTGGGPVPSGPFGTNMGTAPPLGRRPPTYYAPPNKQPPFGRRQPTPPYNPPGTVTPNLNTNQSSWPPHGPRGW